MEPEEVERWVAVVRDSAIVAVATLFCVAQVVWIAPNTLLIGGAVTLFGLPLALRLDLRRQRHRNGKSLAPPSDDDHNGDPYDGPGGYYRHD